MPKPKKITVRGYLIHPGNHNLANFRRRRRAITRRIQKKVNADNKSFEQRFTLRRGNNWFNSENINPNIFHRDNPPNITYLPLQVLPKNHVSPHVWNTSFSPTRPVNPGFNTFETVFNPLYSNQGITQTNQGITQTNQGITQTNLHHAYNNAARKRLENKFLKINYNYGPVHLG